MPSQIQALNSVIIGLGLAHLLFINDHDGYVVNHIVKDDHRILGVVLSVDVSTHFY